MTNSVPSVPEDVRKELSRSSFLAMGLSKPNPPVAAVITDFNDKILASGYTQEAGGPHAERVAYQEFIPKDHILWVTLQPCTHFGKTPPCMELIEKYHPKKVYFGGLDPNPLVQTNTNFENKSHKFILHPELQKLGETYLLGFYQSFDEMRPRVWIKSAIDSQNHYTDRENQRIKISSQESDFFSNLLRAKMDAILVGPKTIEIDQPNLSFKNNYQHRTNPISFGEPFFESLFQIPKSDYEIHQRRYKDYQPFRVFFLGNESENLLKWIEIQRNLNEELNSKKVILFLTKPSASYSANFINKLNSITENKIFEIDLYDQNAFPSIIQSLNKIQKMQNILVEGGRSLYDLFLRNSKSGDRILLIQNTSLKIPHGNEFPIPEKEWNDSLKIPVANDVWKVLSIDYVHRNH